MIDSAQAYYDELVAACVDGRFPSVDDQGNCLYRGPCGKACAVGLLIPDEIYREDLEGSRVATLPDGVKEKIIPPGLTLTDLTLVQSRHDVASVTTKCGVIHFRQRKEFVRDFLAEVNMLACFDDVDKADPEEVAARVP